MSALEESEVDLGEDGCLWLENDHFSGKLLVRDKKGRLSAEESYFRGLLHGPFREFDAEGKVICVGTHFGGAYHGVIRTFDTNGEMQSELEYEHGVRTAQRDFQDGEIVETWRLSSDDPEYSFLESVRLRYAWEGWDEWKTALQRSI